MSRRKIRAFAAVAVVGGSVAFAAATSFAAAPLPNATSDANGGTASALGLPGVLTVSESKTDATSSQWSAVSVGGNPVIGNDSAGWIGPAAPAGALLDLVNGITCAIEPGPVQDLGVSPCIKVLGGQSNGTDAGGAVLVVNVLVNNAGEPLAGNELSVLPSRAGRGCAGGFSKAALIYTHRVAPGINAENDIGLTESGQVHCAP